MASTTPPSSTQRGVRTHLLARVEQVQGKPLSFNNLGDLSAARMLARELEGPAAVIVKHANPCGVALGATIHEAYDKALAADTVSAYGGVVVLNRPVGAELGKALAAQFVEVLFAPGYHQSALEALGEKSTRVLADGERRSFVTSERDLKRVFGGLLVQDRDADGDPLDAMDVVCGDPDATTGPLSASIAAAVTAYERGATILRVHDVKEHVEALTAARAVVG